MVFISGPLPSRRSEWENIKWGYLGDGAAWFNLCSQCHVAKWAEDCRHSKHCRLGVSAWWRASADDAARLLRGLMFLRGATVDKIVRFAACENNV